MVDGDNEQNEQLYEPMPFPLVVIELAMVGDGEVLQQIPRAETVDPPQSLTFPPLLAVIAKMDDTLVVVTTGTVSTAMVVKVRTLPYEVPAEFVA